MPARLPRLLLILLSVAPLVRGADAAVPPTAGYSIDTYASLGSSFAQNARLAELGWTERQFDAFIDGLRATFRGRPYAFSPDAQRLQADVGERVQQLMAHDMRTYFADPARLDAYMKQRAKELHLQLSDSGLAFGLMSRNGNSRPGPDETVVVTYQAVAADGQTELPGLSADHRRVRVDALLPGLAEGVQMMAAGGSAIFIVPPALSYGDGPWPAGVERGTPLIFTVVLHEIVSGP
jgi:FKBP-type peptidyl-prolyl cis-trans isomerase